MASRLERLRRSAICGAGAVVLGAAGCAFPNGTTGGDPLLGSFNRPIVPTPPPERAGLGPDTPAYDAGARIGVTSPDVPSQSENPSGFLTLPTLTSPNLLSGARLPFAAPDDGLARRAQPITGARLPTPNESPLRLPASPTGGRPLPDNGSAGARLPDYKIDTPAPSPATEPAPAVRLVSHEALRDPAKVKSMEEAQALLQALGARAQRTEQREDGEWSCSCTVGPRPFEARAREPLAAMRLLLEQVHKNR